MNPIVCVALCSILSLTFLGWGFMYLLLEDRYRAERREQTEAHREQIASLLQRIQAPENAVAEHTAQVMRHPEPRVAAFDNDESYWQAIGHDPLETEVTG